MSVNLITRRAFLALTGAALAVGGSGPLSSVRAQGLAPTPTMRGGANNYLPGAPIVLDAVQRVGRKGLPPIFAYVYPETWRALQLSALAPGLRALLGEGYRQLPRSWITIVRPVEGARGWEPHLDATRPASVMSDGRFDRLTVWIALSDATVDNGCPHVAKGLHRKGTLVHQFNDPLGWEIFEEYPDTVAAPVGKGGIVVFSSLSPHLTGPNTTDAVRKSYILQYAPVGAEVLLGDASAGEPSARMSAHDAARQFPILIDDQPVARHEL